jgi:hypothetical protein
MSVFDFLLGLRSIEDLTETNWWAETVFRELERNSSLDQGTHSELPAVPVQSPAESS